MEEPQTIYFTKSDNHTDEQTTWYCVKMTWHYLVLSVKKISRIINTIVHNYAWLVLAIVIDVSCLISSVFIRSARAERDEACQRQYKLEQQVQSLQYQLEASK